MLAVEVRVEQFRQAERGEEKPYEVPIAIGVWI